MIRVGTCSWTEKSLLQSGEFYPPGVTSAEGRLRFYASHFNVAEVDSSYYAIPAQHTAELWAERTPPGFIFHIKAYRALTGHGTDPKTLPKDFREELPPADRGLKTIYIKDLDFLTMIAGRFRDSLIPLRSAGKLGLVVMQFPPWFHYSHENLDHLVKCKNLLAGLDLAIEFRHGSWLTPARVDQVLSFLRKHNLTYIAADEPQYDNLATVPFIPAATTDTAYLRLHGRNKNTWLARGIETSLRFDYLYNEGELGEFASAAVALDRWAKTTFVMFNNCRAGHAMIDALQLIKILQMQDKHEKTGHQEG